MFSKKFALVFSVVSMFVGFASAQGATKKTCNPNDPFCELHYLDTDGGETPEVAGCYVESTQNDCSAATIKREDSCDNSDELTEYVGPSACTTSTTFNFRVISCQTYCTEKYNLDGQCVEQVAASCNNELLGACLCGDRR